MMLQKTNSHNPTLTILLTFLCGLFIQCHSNNIGCKDLKNGRFHFYGKHSEIHFLLIRQDSIQKEVNVVSNDTSYWKLKWINDCTYTANYLSGGGMKSEDEQKFLRSHTTIIEIQKATPEFYIIKGALDSLNSKMTVVDTVWMRAK